MAASTAASLPIYTAVALAGFLTEAVVRLVSNVTSTARAGSRAVATAAAVPALAAAGMIWELKDALQTGEGEARSAASTLMAQPSILNWHDMPAVAQ